MKYFNVHYKCLDARYDCSAKRDKGDGDICYQWATTDMLDELDEMHDSELATTGADFNIGAKYEGTEEDTIGVLRKQGKIRRT